MVMAAALLPRQPLRHLVCILSARESQWNVSQTSLASCIQDSIFEQS